MVPEDSLSYSEVRKIYKPVEPRETEGRNLYLYRLRYPVSYVYVN